jgi:hypothetical protein
VALNAFSRPPFFLFARRILAPGLGVFLVGFICLGIVSGAQKVEGVRTPSGTKMTPDLEVTLPPTAAAVLHLKNTAATWGELHAVCLIGNTVNDFQREQCGEIWTRIGIMTGIASLPFMLMGIFLLLSFDQFRFFYRRIDRKVEKGQGSFKGRIRGRVRSGKFDLFAWLFCLQAVEVETTAKKVVQVYLPLDMDLPSPGQTLAVFDAGIQLGAKRLVAVIYAPHLAVIAGS